MADPRPRATPEGAVVGVRCTRCEHPMATARPVCARCGGPVVEATFGPEGRVYASTVVRIAVDSRVRLAAPVGGDLVVEPIR